MRLSRQEYWSGLPCTPPGDLPDPRIEPTSLASPALQMDSLPTEPSVPATKAKIQTLITPNVDNDIEQ